MKSLKAYKDVTAAEIARRRKRMVKEMGDMADTPDSLAKHWGKYAPAPAKEFWSPDDA